MALISVVIPVYNGEKTIPETIQSVLEQTWTDWEIIVINDGSTDSTLEIVNGMDAPQLKVFSYANGGVSASRNRGIALAKGEYIAFLDADDLWTSDKLEAQFKALQDHPEAVLAYSWTDYIDEQGQFLYPGSHITVNGDVYTQLLLGNFLENGSNPLIRKDALTAIGNFDQSLPPAEDWDLFLRLAARYAFIAVPSAQVLYRISKNSASANIVRQEQQCLKVLERAYGRSRRDPLRGAPESLQSLKKQSLGNLYQYLTFKALESKQTRETSLIAARCFWQSIGYDSTILWRRSRLMAIVFLKILAGIILPPKLTQELRRMVKSRK